MTIVPDIDKAHVKEFCKGICHTCEPVYLDALSDGGGQLNCFMNVEERMTESGGSIQYGWRIREWRNTMIEAEFHAVWRAPDGSLTDVTPIDDEPARILFLPDDRLQYEGRQVNNIRQGLFTHPLLTEFIELSNEQFEILNAGHRADMNTDPSMSSDQLAEFWHQLKLTEEEKTRLDFIRERKVYNQICLSPCECGSRLRAFRCCLK